MAWTPLHIKEEELLLSHTLPIGQTFRWVETQQDFYTGMRTKTVVTNFASSRFG